jgi:ubiquinone biosynthesis protein
LDRVKSHPRRVMVATDWSETADRAVLWAADLADRYVAELHLIQVVPALHSNTQNPGENDRLEQLTAELSRLGQSVAGDRARAKVAVSEDPAIAIVRAAATNDIDVLVVGNTGMAGRKEFLLGNIPNRISHNARCTVIIVNTRSHDDNVDAESYGDDGSQDPTSRPHRTARLTTIATIFAKHGLRELFSTGPEDGATGGRGLARRFRSALEELGPTFAKLGQLLSTRPDLLPPGFVEELSCLQDRVTPLSEAEVVRVMEQDLGVPWEDVFETIEREPLACGTIGQVHRATLAGGEKVVIKVQRPEARHLIAEDLALLKVFAEQIGTSPGARRWLDIPALFEHLSASLQRELDFRLEAKNAERLRDAIADFNRLAVPSIRSGLSTSRLLVMQDVAGLPVASVPEGALRQNVARQLVESFCKQILIHGFFHADPHPGNLMWQPEELRLYFLDLGSVGEVDADLRELMILVLTAFWQQDTAFLSDVLLMLAKKNGREPNIDAFRKDLSGVIAKHRGGADKNVHLDAILQDVTEASLRHGVVMPGSLALTGKALAQMQRVTSQLDPALDPFDAAGKFLARWLMRRTIAATDPKSLFYEAQKLKFRAVRVFEAVERLVGAQPGQKADLSFRATHLEKTLAKSSRRLALGLTAGFALLASALAATSGRLPLTVPVCFGLTGAGLLLWLIIDLAQREAPSDT